MPFARASHREHHNAADSTSTTAGDELPPVLESGIPPAVGYGRALELDESIQHALAESARIEGNLNQFLRGMRALMAGASALRDSHTALRAEIERVRAAVRSDPRTGDSSADSVRALEAALERARDEAARERSALIEEQNAFIAELLSEHERQLAELKRNAVASYPNLPRNELDSWVHVEWDELEELEPAPHGKPPPLPRHLHGTMPGLGARDAEQPAVRSPLRSQPTVPEVPSLRLSTPPKSE